ncbi:MAG: phosphonate ABC transporter, permease protein PhnE [Candidatus Methylomirabilales bacterium]
MSQPLMISRRTPGAGWRHLAWGGGLLAVILWSFHGTESNFTGLIGGQARRDMLAYVINLFPPDLTPGFLRQVGWGAVETFAISFLGTLLAVGIALALVFFASHTLTFSGLLFAMERARTRRIRLALFWTARGTLNLLRSIPEIVWAIIFVFVVGLGPFAGVLALGVHTGGVLGKLFAEVLENVDTQPIEALQGTGARRPAILMYGILPQALPHFVSFALYRWEVNIRAAAILGFVGAGGLGQQFRLAVNLFWDHQILTLLLAVLLMVTFVDYLSAYLRRTLL